MADALTDEQAEAAYAASIEREFPAAEFIPVSAERERPRWLELRRTGIGSSDAAACLNLSKWGTPLGVYADKLGLAPERHAPELTWGTRLEQPIGLAYGEQAKCDVAKPAGMFRSKARPWQVANVDLVNDGGKIVEVKTSRDGYGFGEPGTDLVPDDHLLQGQHQMVVLDADEMDLAVLIAGSDFRVYTLRRDETIARHLNEIEEQVWEHVKRKLPPAPTWSHPTTVELMKHLAVPDPALRGITATQEQARWAADYNMLGEQLKDLEKKRAEVKARLEEAMDDQPLLFLPNGTHVRRKLVQRKGYTVEPGSYVDFRILKTRD